MIVMSHIAMGWLQFVGSLKSQVSFAEEPCKRDDRKLPIMLQFKARTLCSTHATAVTLLSIVFCLSVAGDWRRLVL